MSKREQSRLAKRIDQAYKEYWDDYFAYMQGLIHGCCGSGRYTKPAPPDCGHIIAKFVRQEMEHNA